jgi:hypothetical protein
MDSAAAWSKLAGMSIRTVAAVSLAAASLAGCGRAPVVLQGGSVRVIFAEAETCGFDNPYVVPARGCRVIDDNALMCKGFGVIDGVLFAGGCEARAEIQVIETQGTMPTPVSGSDPQEPAEEDDVGSGDPLADDPPLYD